MENNAVNSQIQNERQQNSGGMTYSTNTVTNPKLPKASKVATIGMSVVMVGSVISMIISFMIQAQMSRFSSGSGVGIGTFIGIAIVVLFLVLAQKMKSAKSKALPIVLIVFSAIFLGLGVIGLLFIGVQMNLLETTVKTSSVLSKDFSKTVDSIKQIVMLSYIPSIISIVGWGITLYGSIIGNSATKDEFEANN